jgi:hypothetical protein
MIIVIFGGLAAAMRHASEGGCKPLKSHARAFETGGSLPICPGNAQLCTLADVSD